MNSEILKKLENAIAQSKAGQNVKSYDFPDPNSVAELLRRTDSLFKERIKLIRRLKGDDFRETDSDCGEETIKRRKQALIAKSPEFCRRFKAKYPNLSIADELLFLIWKRGIMLNSWSSCQETA